MGYEIKEETLSDENILYFHLSHKTIKNFSYEPNIIYEEPQDYDLPRWKIKIL